MNIDYLTVKEDDIFIVSDKLGNIPMNNTEGYGLYTSDTRFLSGFELKINQKKPILLSAKENENYINKIYLSNHEYEIPGQIVPKESVVIKRNRFINNLLYEKIEIRNYNNFTVNLKLEFEFAADYKDILDIRNFSKIDYKGEKKFNNSKERLLFQYQGEDKILRETEISFKPHPQKIDKNKITYEIILDSKEKKDIYLYIKTIADKNKDHHKKYEEALTEIKSSYHEWEENTTKIKTDNQELNKLLKRSSLDLRTLMTDFGQGDFPVAGIPWYVCPFGRDGLITGLQMMILNSETAKSILRTLAEHQGETRDTSRDEEPGKIFHELRFGEMANLNQIPHTPYYGTADATPLFLILIAKYYNWSADLTFVKELLPHIKKALNWINKYGDKDEDGFVEYESSPEIGYEVKVWKDSQDSMRHRDGSIAESPMAVSEVQGYIYRAKRDLIPILDRLNEEELKEKLEIEIKSLKDKFTKEFWLYDQDFYALALDRNKEKVASITSNIGQCLWTGIIPQEKAENIVKRLVAEDMFSGWGVRTMSEINKGYNPISYHNGSVWPHENSIIASGIKKYGYSQIANKIIKSIIEVSQEFDNYRLPELYCGFNRNEGLVKYPMSCSPQAWAAAAPFLLLETILGLEVDLPNDKLYLNPDFPTDINYIKLEDLILGDEKISFELKRIDDEVKLNLLTKTEVEIIFDK
ncbi:MAG: glycogen debranching N-terminal domain-containing protein [Halanaerobium sp.]